MFFVQKTYWMLDKEINQEMVKKCFAQKSKDSESRSMYSFPHPFLLSIAGPRGED